MFRLKITKAADNSKIRPTAADVVDGLLVIPGKKQSEMQLCFPFQVIQ